MTKKKYMYKRIFVLYFAVVTTAVAFLAAFSINRVNNTIKNQQLFLNKKVIEQTSEYIDRKYDNSKELLWRLYSTESWRDDLIYYINNNHEKYLNHKLDSLYKSDKLYYMGLQSYIKSAFGFSSGMKRISLYNYQDNSLSIFQESGALNTYENAINPNKGNTKEQFDEVMLKNLSTEGVGNKYISIMLDLKNPLDLNNIGKIIFTYDISDIKQILDHYNEAHSKILLIGGDDVTFYDSSKVYQGNNFPYVDKLKSKQMYYDNGNKYFGEVMDSKSEMKIVGIISQRDINYLNRSITWVIYALAAALAILVNTIIYTKLKTLELRTNYIVNSMEKLEKGDFDVRIPVDKENDELSFISLRFNEMCDKLHDYVKEVYISQIKQKKAEVTALQNQINPHFLFNTLESIRMKAISNGDREVGKMLYNMASLFRNMVKGDSTITIRQELEHCKMYLELFKFRYPGVFDYNIVCNEELYNYEVIKFSFQPLIENFIVHGMDMDRSDNYVEIALEDLGEEIKIFITDNGIGIESERIEEINEKISKKENLGKSIGIVNVHERISMTYGSSYGVKVDKSSIGGAKIIVNIPKLKEANDE